MGARNERELVANEPERHEAQREPPRGDAGLDTSLTKGTLRSFAVILLLAGLLSSVAAFRSIDGRSSDLMTMMSFILAACAFTGSAVALTGNTVIMLLERRIGRG